MKSKPSFTLAFCLPLLLAVGCGANKPVSEQASSPSPVLSAPPLSSTFVPKQVPVLGTSYAQMTDEADVLNIIVSGKSHDEIRETSLAGVKPNPIAVKLGYPPKGTDVCKLPYSALIRAMYEKCVVQGMSPIDVANILGWEGKEVSSAGAAKTYEWRDGKGGSMMVVFEGDRLVSKSQAGLKP
jgi:hypothetical protein